MTSKHWILFFNHLEYFIIYYRKSIISCSDSSFMRLYVEHQLSLSRVKLDTSVWIKKSQLPKHILHFALLEGSDTEWLFHSTRNWIWIFPFFSEKIKLSLVSVYISFTYVLSHSKGLNPPVILSVSVTFRIVTVLDWTWHLSPNF